MGGGGIPAFHALESRFFELIKLITGLISSRLEPGWGSDHLLIMGLISLIRSSFSGNYALESRFSTPLRTDHLIRGWRVRKSPTKSDLIKDMIYAFPISPGILWDCMGYFPEF
jgi:hypothetical protein